MRFLYLLFILSYFDFSAQTSYKGFIDTYPIEMVMDIYLDKEVNAVYVYSKFDNPINLNGKIKNGKLILHEKDEKNITKASFTFENFDSKSQQIEGYWTDLKTNKKLKISLIKIFDIENGEQLEWKNKELLQNASMKNYYFKAVVTKNKEDYYAKITGLKIFEKKSDKCMQQLELECQLRGFDNLTVDDYNFDGIADFSIFEQSFAGPNTSSIYYLYNPSTKKFDESTFSGTSLEFNPKTKRIYEHNQCCAGRSHMNAEYKIVKNKMVLIKRTCSEYDENTGDYKKVKCN